MCPRGQGRPRGPHLWLKLLYAGVATETAKSNSRTFLDHFPKLFHDCLRFVLQDLKFNFHYYFSCTYFFVLVIEKNFDVTHSHAYY